MSADAAQSAALRGAWFTRMIPREDEKGKKGRHAGDTATVASQLRGTGPPPEVPVDLPGSGINKTG